MFNLNSNPFLEEYNGMAELLSQFQLLEIHFISVVGQGWSRAVPLWFFEYWGTAPALLLRTVMSNKHKDLWWEAPPI
jgi:hypothetical protein